MNNALNGKKYAFEFTLDNPSGNSLIKNPYAPQSELGIKVEYYKRTKQMTESMWYLYENQKEELGKKNARGEEVEENKEKKIL